MTMMKKYEQLALYVSAEEKIIIKNYALANGKSVAKVLYDAVASVVDLKKKVVENVESGTNSTEGSDTFP